MAIVALANAVRGRTGTVDARGDVTTVAGEHTDATPPTPVAGGRSEENGSPILRVLAGMLAVLFAAVPILGKWPPGDLLLMAILALMFGWYAAFGRKGLPPFLAKK
jgi:hypothetical protein